MLGILYFITCTTVVEGTPSITLHSVIFSIGVNVNKVLHLKPSKAKAGRLG